MKVNKLDLQPDHGFYPAYPEFDVPLERDAFIRTEDVAEIVKFLLNSEGNKPRPLIWNNPNEESDVKDSDSNESVLYAGNRKCECDNVDDLKSVKMFIGLKSIVMNSMSASTSWLIDSGAGLSGTNNKNLLICLSTCHVPITPAFGEMISATAEGSIRDHKIEQLNIRALHIDKMHQNLLSVHQLCEGGNFRNKQIGVFTDEGCRFFPLDMCRDALKLLSSKKQIFYGLAKNGVYVYAQSDQTK